MVKLSADFLDFDKMVERIELTPITTNIVFTDGSSSFSSRNPEDIYDPEKGIAFALLNRLFGQGLWKKVRDFIPKECKTVTNNEIEKLKEEIKERDRRIAKLQLKLENQRSHFI